MAARVVSRNNVIAGLFVLASMILAIAVSVVVSGVQKRLIPTRPYSIRFRVSDGASGLKIGSPVTLGGQEVGRVNGIAFDPPEGSPTGVLVRVAVNSRITLYKDAWAFLEHPLLGSMSTINFSRVGGGSDKQPPAAVLAEGDTLDGTIAPPAFLAQAGFGPDQARELQEMFADARATVTHVRQISERVDSQLEPGLRDLRQSLSDVGAVTDDFRKRWAGWADKTGSIIGKADDAADKLNMTLADSDALIRDARAVITDNRPMLDRSMQNIDAGIQRWKTESLDRINEALATGKSGAEEFARLMTQLRQTVQEETPNIQKTLANFRLASDQVKLTGIEVRRNPWRLLYSPKTKELESELFYDAARTYAAAVSDLRAASESLEIVTKGPDAPSVEHETLIHIITRLDAAFKQYQDAEKELLRRMETKNP